MRPITSSDTSSSDQSGTDGVQRISATPEDESFLSAGGEVGQLMRSLDWSATPMGPVASWPQSVKTAVRIMLASRFPMFIWWGKELTNLYNDPYRAFLGIKHPDALGRPAREVWAEIWDQIGPRADAVLKRGGSTYDEALMLLMERFGYPEETYFTFSYSPLPDDQGRVGGLFCAVTEDTPRVIGERRLGLLHEVAAATSECRTPEEVCQAASECLSRAQRDLPFSLIYLIQDDGMSLKRVCQVGIADDHPAAPEFLNLDETDCVWPFVTALQNRDLVILDRLSESFEDLPTGEWSRSPDAAVLVPIAQQGQNRPAGIFVAALNPHRKFDHEFRGFVSLLANQIAAGLGNALAYETERRRAEQLAQLDRAKTLFFSNVSHEFRTPLTLMLGPLEELAERPRGQLSREDQEQLAVARRNSLRLLKLVNTLLDFSRIEAGRVQAVYEPVDLCSLTSEIAGAFQSAMQRAGLQFTIGCEPLGEQIYVDRDMWEKIVLNLLSNAFKFTFEGEVAVRLSSENGAVRLVVSDTGVGIPEHELPRVFERFHRIESSRARSYEGTGIGLALVQELARLHGGAIHAESTLGQGSTFTVSIPKGKAHLPADRIGATRTSSTALGGDAFVEEAQRWLPAVTEPETASEAAASVTGVPTGATSARELILVADDNADMREYVSRLLGPYYDVHAVSDGVEAVNTARRLQPALIVTDVMMPRLDGFGVLRAIRGDSSVSSIPVIVLSGRAGEDSHVEGLEAGADDYLIKPFTARELLARVASHVKMSRQRRDAADREARLRAEAELEREQLKELLRQAPAAIGLLSGPEHRWTYVNDMYVRVTGRNSPEDFLGKTIREALPEVEGQGLFELLDQVYGSGEPVTGREMKVRLNRAATGQPDDAYFDFVYHPIRNTDSEVDGILIHAVETTTQIAARKAIEISEERLRLAQNAAHIGTWEWDPVCDTRELSAELHEMFGTHPDQPHHEDTWSARVHRADWQMVQDEMEAGYRSGTMNFEYRYHHPEHGLRWFHCQGRRIAGDTRMVGVLMDVTDRKQVEMTRTRLAAIVANSDDAIISKDLNGIVTSWNAVAETIFGYSADEMIGRSILTIIPPELQDDERRILSTIARGERVDHFETVRVNKYGERIDVSLTISPLRDQSGKIVGAAKIARDITQRKKAEHALRTAERLASVGRLAATVAHEINNPLEAITNLVYLARLTSVRDDVRGYLAQAEEELERVSQLTKQTLGFYRENRAIAATHIGPLVSGLLSVFASRIRNKAIDLHTDIRHDPEIMVVPGEIRQLLANILSNSIDAVGRGGRIRIRIDCACDPSGTDGVRLTVGDSGPGIPRSIRSKLFEPFFTTKKDVGTGLGLWVCKSIVEKHGGTIRVKSNVNPGRTGTTFSVFLPLQHHEAAAEEELRKCA